jgi:hypothetical protein
MHHCPADNASAGKSAVALPVIGHPTPQPLTTILFDTLLQWMIATARHSSHFGFRNTPLGK